MQARSHIDWSIWSAWLVAKYNVHYNQYSVHTISKSACKSNVLTIEVPTLDHRQFDVQAGSHVIWSAWLVLCTLQPV